MGENNNKYIVEKNFDTTYNIRTGPKSRFQIRSRAGALVAWLPEFNPQKMHWRFYCESLDLCMAHTYNGHTFTEYTLQKDAVLDTEKTATADIPEKFKEDFETYLNNNENDYLYTDGYYGKSYPMESLNFHATEYHGLKAYYYSFKYNIEYRTIYYILQFIILIIYFLTFMLWPKAKKKP